MKKPSLSVTDAAFRIVRETPSVEGSAALIISAPINSCAPEPCPGKNWKNAAKLNQCFLRRVGF